MCEPKVLPIEVLRMGWMEDACASQSSDLRGDGVFEDHYKQVHTGATPRQQLLSARSQLLGALLLELLEPPPAHARTQIS